MGNSFRAERKSTAPWYINLALGCVCLIGSAGVNAITFPDKYDAEIEDAVETWLPGLDWRLYKAQLFQESKLDPDAVSPVGARGIAQFMPGTWDDVASAMGMGAVSPHDAELAIVSGAFYMRRLRRGWSAPRPERDRHDLALASYNAGFGNLLSAQDACGGPNLYPEIIACLPEITGHHSRETITYVKRIHRWHRALVFGTWTR